MNAAVEAVSAAARRGKIYVAVGSWVLWTPGTQRVKKQYLLQTICTCCWRNVAPSVTYCRLVSGTRTAFYSSTGRGTSQGSTTRLMLRMEMAMVRSFAQYLYFQ